MGSKGWGQATLVGVLIGALGCATTTYRLTPTTSGQETDQCVERCTTNGSLNLACSQSCGVAWQEEEGLCSERGAAVLDDECVHNIRAACRSRCTLDTAKSESASRCADQCDEAKPPTFCVKPIPACFEQQKLSSSARAGNAVLVFLAIILGSVVFLSVACSTENPCGPSG